MYAVKFFNILDKNQASQLYNEIYTLASFQCDALISLKGVFHQQGCIGIVLEFMDLGSLEGLIKYTEAGNIIPEEALAGIAFQVIWGLCYLNYENQIHRDIKPGNILMVRSLCLYLTLLRLTFLSPLEFPWFCEAF